MKIDYNYPTKYIYSINLKKWNYGEEELLREIIKHTKDASSLYFSTEWSKNNILNFVIRSSWDNKDARFISDLIGITFDDEKDYIDIQLENIIESIILSVQNNIDKYSEHQQDIINNLCFSTVNSFIHGPEKWFKDGIIDNSLNLPSHW